MGWESCGLDQRAGSESFASTAESSERRRAGSKILPQVAYLVADGGEGEFEIRKHLGDLSFSISLQGVKGKLQVSAELGAMTRAEVRSD